MRRTILMALACGLLCTAALADDRGDGSYEFTWVRQYNGQTYVVRQRISEERYNQLRAQLTSASQGPAQNSGPVDRRGNGASIDQHGYNDYAGIDQRGRGHYGAIGQYGNNDNAAVRQRGSANVTFVNQAGSNLNATPSQSGDHNITLVDQWNGAPAQPVWGGDARRRARRDAALRNEE